MYPDKTINLVDDFSVWENFKSGNEEALSLIFRQHYSFLYHYGMKLTYNSDVTKDCIQDLFFAIWKNRENLKTTSSIKFYLLKSLRRKIARTLKSQKKHSEHSLADDYEFEFEFSVENLLIKEESLKDQQEYLIQLLNALPKRQKEAIYLKFYQGLSYQEIGEVMNLNYQTLRNHMHLALATLRSKIKISAGALYFLLSMCS
jgi:RNA polymerase sigma factor (sigma-70 family)